MSSMAFDPHYTPILIIATEAPKFDTRPWSDEGYDVRYVGACRDRLLIEDVVDDLESSDRYAIIAFGAAATAALHFAITPSRTLRALAAYYPPTLPAPSFHPSVQILLHLPNSCPFSPAQSSTLTTRVYQGVDVGFAESKSPTHERFSASLAFSRTLGMLRATVGPKDPDLDSVWSEHMHLEFSARDAERTMGTMVDEAYVNHVPTMTGGCGYTNLLRFYRDFFIPNNPRGMRMALVSRTVGADRIVDEVVMSFRHDTVIDWMLPGVEPTGRDVEIALVIVVTIRGGKLFNEHIYWDQASVLVQIGLIKPEGLPVCGVEAARKVLDGKLNSKGLESNKLIPKW